jgi:hypothetical protein
MDNIELTAKNIELKEHNEKGGKYPTQLPTAFVPTNKEKTRTMSMASESTDSVISNTRRKPNGEGMRRQKKRRLSTIDVLYQMQTQQTESDVPTSTCTETSIHPHSEFRTRWDIVISMCLAYNAIAIPYRVCFNEIATTEEAVFWFDRTIDLAFVVDVILNFYTGYVRNKDNQIELNPKKVKWNYFTSWFTVDLLSSIPYELIIIASIELADASDARATESAQLLKNAKFLKSARYIRFIKLAKVLRLLRALHIVKRFEKVCIIFVIISGQSVVTPL